MRRLLCVLVVTCGIVPSTGCQSCLDCFNRFEAWKCQTFFSGCFRNPCPSQPCDPCANQYAGGYPAGTVLGAGDNWGGWQDQCGACPDQCGNPCGNPCGDACGNACQDGCGSTIGVVGAPAGNCCNGNAGVSGVPLQTIPGSPTINGGVTSPGGMTPGPETYAPSIR